MNFPRDIDQRFFRKAKTIAASVLLFVLFTESDVCILLTVSGVCILHQNWHLITKDKCYF